MSLRYSISILTYSAVEAARKCLASVVANSPVGEYELLLTANGSDAAGKLFDEFAAANANVRVVHNPTNVGFIAPNIRALEMATGEFFICLNDDATVPPGWLEKLRQPFDADPMMGLTGPEGGCCTWDARIQGMPGRTPEYVEFACAMGRASVLRKFGLFDRELTHSYFEDCELSLRLREARYALKLVPFRIVHQRGATSKFMPEIRKYQAMNGAYFRRRHAGYLKARRFDYVTLIKRAAAYGDVLLLTPIIRALNERNPRSPIWVETQCGEVLDRNPRVARCGRNLPVPHDAWVIDLNMAYENAPLTPIVAAYAAKAGVRDYSCRTEIYPSAEDRAFGQRVDEEWVAVHAGPTTWSGKNLSVAKWRELIPMMDAKVVLVGSASKEELPCTLDLRGKTSIGQLAAVIERCRALITVDSLPLHVAQAVGTPVVALFGVTSPEFILTDSSPSVAVCSDRLNPSTGIRHRTTGETMVRDCHACMDTIEVDAVMQAFERLPARMWEMAQ